MNDILAYAIIGIVLITFIIGLVCWVKGINEALGMNESDSDINNRKKR